MTAKGTVCRQDPELGNVWQLRNLGFRRLERASTSVSPSSACHPAQAWSLPSSLPAVDARLTSWHRAPLPRRASCFGLLSYNHCFKCFIILPLELYILQEKFTVTTEDASELGDPRSYVCHWPFLVCIKYPQCPEHRIPRDLQCVSGHSVTPRRVPCATSYPLRWLLI